MADKITPTPYLSRRTSTDEYIFGFITGQDVEYRISFKPTDYLFENVPDLKWKTYEFIISPVFVPPGIKSKKDERIPVTIAAIFYSFYRDLPNDVVIYICDSSDRKERIRERLFNSWYYDFKKDERFMKLDIALDPKQPDRIDFCVIMKLNNPHKYDIIHNLENFKADIESDK